MNRSEVKYIDEVFEELIEHTRYYEHFKEFEYDLG